MNIVTIDTTGWSSEDIRALTEATREAADAAAMLEAELAAERAAETSPAALIAARRAAAEEARAELARREQDRRDKAAIVAAEKRYGKDRVAVVETRDGAIVLRCPTPRELDEMAARLGADGLPDVDRERIARDAYAALVVHPDRPAFSALTTSFPAVWGRIRVAVDELSDGSRRERAKK